MPAPIRARTVADLAPLARELAAVAAMDGYPGRWPADPMSWLRGSHPLGAWVADSGGRVLGHVMLREPRDQPPVTMWCAATGGASEQCALLGRLFVVRQARGQGLGERLVHAATAAAARRGLCPVLDVAERNADAVRLYQRLGWRRFGSYQQAFVDDGPVETLLCFAGTAPEPERVREGGA